MSGCIAEFAVMSGGVSRGDFPVGVRAASNSAMPDRTISAIFGVAARVSRDAARAVSNFKEYLCRFSGWGHCGSSAAERRRIGDQTMITGLSCSTLRGIQQCITRTWEKHYV